MRIISLAISLLLHAAAAFVFVYHADRWFTQKTPSDVPIRIQLVETEAPKDLPPLKETELPDHLRPQPPRAPVKAQPPAPCEPAEFAPQAAKTPSRPATKDLDDAPASPAPAEEEWAGPDAPPPPPGAVDISPIKRPAGANASDIPRRPIYIHQGLRVNMGKGNMTLKVGAVGRTLAALVEVDFDESDYAGHYVTTTGRTVLVIDGREIVGALVVQDLKTGMTRRLARTDVNTFVFVYGPDFQDTAPGEGSLTFLPGDATYIHRFIWLPKSGPAEFPVKVRSRRKRVAYECRGASRTATVYLPPEQGRYPAVALAVEKACEPTALHASFGRMLAAEGVVALVPDGSQCSIPKERRKPPSVEQAARDSWAAVDFLSNLPEVDASRVGVWGRRARGLEIAAAMARGRYLPFAVVSLSASSQVEIAVRDSRLLSGLGRASRVLLAVACAQDAAACLKAEAALEKACPECEFQVSKPLCPGFEGDKAWLCRMAGHAKTAGPWIVR